MKKILIPTDFSETSMNAIKYAMQLLKYDKSEFTIMNAFADEVYENTNEMGREDFEKFKNALLLTKIILLGFISSFSIIIFSSAILLSDCIIFNESP